MKGTHILVILLNISKDISIWNSLLDSTLPKKLWNWWEIVLYLNIQFMSLQPRLNLCLLPGTELASWEQQICIHYVPEWVKG